MHDSCGRGKLCVSFHPEKRRAALASYDAVRNATKDATGSSNASILEGLLTATRIDTSSRSQARGRSSAVGRWEKSADDTAAHAGRLLIADRGSGASCVACKNIPLRVCEGVNLSWSSGELGRRLGCRRHQLAGGLQLAADESRAFERRGVHRRLDNHSYALCSLIFGCSGQIIVRGQTTVLKMPNKTRNNRS